MTFHYSTYSFKCSVAKTRLTLVFKLHLNFLIYSTKALSFSSMQHCTSQLQSKYRLDKSVCFKTKRATAQHCMKSCNVKHNSESVFHYFASVKDFYAICSHSSFQKVGYVPLYPFHKVTGLLNSLCTANQPDGIHLAQTYLIRIWDSPDHWRVRNKEVKFIWIYSLGPRFRVCCPY